MKTMYIWWIGGVALLMVAVGVVVVKRGDETGLKPAAQTTQNQQDSTDQQAGEDLSSYITVEAGDGVLQAATNSGSYVAESARGLEAYLASSGDSVTYTVNITNPGRYLLDVKLSDDGIWSNGDRSVTVTVNDTSTLKYDHLSENTNGWKWYTLGGITLKEGANTIKFTKNPNGYAAYVMDEFRIKPSLVETE